MGPKNFGFGTGSFEDELEAGAWGDEFAPDAARDDGMPENLEDFEEEGGCPECGAPPGIECDPSCPNAEVELVDPDSTWDARRENYDRAIAEVEPGQGNHPEDCECPECNCSVKKESYDFDRFMDRILMNETKRGMPVLNDSPHRKRAIREQDRPANRTRIGGK